MGLYNCESCGYSSDSVDEFKTFETAAGMFTYCQPCIVEMEELDKMS